MIFVVYICRMTHGEISIFVPFVRWSAGQVLFRTLNQRFQIVDITLQISLPVIFKFLLKLGSKPWFMAIAVSPQGI